ncbi:hypothetical protein LTR28_013864, partial [Elasticomyces elasticus]
RVQSSDLGNGGTDHWMSDPAETIRFITYMDSVRGSQPAPLPTPCSSSLQTFAPTSPCTCGRLILQDLSSVIDGLDGSHGLDTRI